MPGPSPLVGYNTNVRHKGKLYHIQTEDSGVNHPHVITHLFADGGRIIASRKTGYAAHLGAKDLQGIVKKLMQEQHKAMFIELRDCVYDEEPSVSVEGMATASAPAASAPAAHAVSAHAVSANPASAHAAPATPPASGARVSPPPPPKPAAPVAPPPLRPGPPLDIDALDRAAEARLAESALGRGRGDARDGVRRGAGRYQQTVPAKPARGMRPQNSPSIFGGEVLRGKSLDEVILSYLSDDVGEGER